MNILSDVLTKLNSSVIGNLPKSSLSNLPDILHINNQNINSILSGQIPPNWLNGLTNTNVLNNVAQSIVSQSGNSDFTSGLPGMDSFVFRGLWAIDGVYFDGIMNTEHTSSLQLTDYPIQDGSTGTDHAIIEPVQLSIDIMMTDCISGSDNNTNNSLNEVYELTKLIANSSNFIEMNRDMQQTGRSAAAYTILLSMQLSRKPLTVETRLRTYKNMMIQNLSAPDSHPTLNALKCTLRMREIITKGVPSLSIAQRQDIGDPVNQGQQYPQTPNENNSVLYNTGNSFFETPQLRPDGGR